MTQKPIQRKIPTLTSEQKVSLLDEWVETLSPDEKLCLEGMLLNAQSLPHVGVLGAKELVASALLVYSEHRVVNHAVSEN